MSNHTVARRGHIDLPRCLPGFFKQILNAAYTRFFIGNQYHGRCCEPGDGCEILSCVADVVKRCVASHHACITQVQGISIRLSFSHKTGRSEEHTSELRSLMRISYAVFCLKKKKINNQ